MNHTLTYICIALAFAITMALITIIQARKEGYRKNTAPANEQLSGGSEKFNAYIEDQTGGDYPERIWFTPADNNSKSYVRGDLCDADRASIVAYLRAQIKRHGILGQIAEEIEQRKDRERR